MTAMPIPKSDSFEFTASTLGLPDGYLFDNLQNPNTINLPDTDKWFKHSVDLPSRPKVKAVEGFLRRKKPPSTGIALTHDRYTLLDAYLDPFVRRYIYLYACQSYSQWVKNKNKPSLIVPSPEFRLFQSYGDTLNKDLYQEDTPQIVYDDSLLSNPAFNQATIETAYNFAARVGYAVKAELDSLDLDKITDDDQIDLTNLVYFVGMLINPGFIAPILQQHPWMEKYLCFALQQTRQVAPLMTSVAPAPPLDIREDYLIRLETLVKQCRHNPHDHEAITSLATVAQQYLDWVENKANQMADEAFVGFFKAMYDLGVALRFPFFENPDDNPNFTAYLATWHHYLSQSFNPELSNNYLVTWYQNAIVQIKAHQARLAELDQTLQANAEALEALPTTSNVTTTDRLRRRQQEIDLQHQKLLLDREKFDVENSQANTLLPPGIDLEAISTLLTSPSTFDLNNLAFTDRLSQALEMAYTHIKEEDQSLLADLVAPHSPVAVPINNKPAPDTALPPETPVAPDEVPDKLVATVTPEPDPDKITPKTAEIALPDKPQGEEKLAIPDSITPLMTDTLRMVEKTITEQFIDCFESDVFIPGHLANDAFSSLIAVNKVEYAAELAYILETHALSNGHLPWQLFKVTYYGMHTWSDRADLNKVGRLLSHLNEGVLSEWCEQAHADVAPYLIFLACLQPAMFGGHSTQAITILNKLKNGDFGAILDGNTKQLIADTIEHANRNEKITLRQLAAAGKPVENVANFDIDVLNRWCQHIRENHRGYAPVLKAMSLSLDEGIFGEIETIIRNNDRNQIDKVVTFIDENADIEASNHLLQSLLVLTKTHDGEGITRVGKSRFYRVLSELVEIAKDWLLNMQHGPQGRVDDYAKRFVTRIQHGIDFFKKTAQNHVDNPGKYAGAILSALHLQRILDVLAKPELALPGERAKSGYTRTKGWYYHPNMLMQANHIADKPTDKIHWLAKEIGQPVNLRQILAQAITAQHVQLCELVSQQLRDIGDTQVLPDTQAMMRDKKRELLELIRKLSGQLENADLSGLIESKQSDKYRDDLNDSEDELESLTPMESTIEIEQFLEGFDSVLQRLFANTKQDMVNRFNIALSRVQSAMGEDAVPKPWLNDMQLAIADDNLPVVSEMLEELESAEKYHQKIKPLEINRNRYAHLLQQFLQHEVAIHDMVTQSDNIKTLMGLLHERGDRLALDGKQLPPNSKKVLDYLYLWRFAPKPKTSIDKDTYEHVVATLQSIGIRAHKPQYNGSLRDSLNYNTNYGFFSMTLKVCATPSSRPFAFFGQNAGNPNISVVVSMTNWNVSHLFQALEKDKIHHAVTVLISAVPVKNAQREEMSRACKVQHKNILVIDPVNLLFLWSQHHNNHDQQLLDNFLWLASPFSYFNPYSSNPTPPPNEMRYGRELQIHSLLNMTNGAAIVFGGRQLGKSTILQEVQTRFNRPNNQQYAFYEMLDSNFNNHLETNEESLKVATHKIWDSLYNWLERQNLIDTKVSDRTAENNSAIMAAVKNSIIKHNDIHVLVIFDEIDKILKVDSAFDFSIFRGIRDFVAQQDVRGRFKVIIGGLANVKRLEDSPNYPLTQMGGSIQVSIMPTQEALQLITEPLLAAGYHFENALVANRILATTNRHPGLIQIFCDELIKYLSRNNNHPVGSRLIRDDDVVNVSQMETVKNLSRERFDMTLNLDKHYLVIVYSLIAENYGSRSFDPVEAKEIAQSWLPDSFSQLSGMQFEAFLIELVGLGVLRPLANGRYAIRNTNVLKLLADTRGKNVIDKLLNAVDDFSYDPLDRHSFDPHKYKKPMPITARDEKAILGSKRLDDISPLRELKLKEFTVNIIVGSDALGLKALEQTLPFLYRNAMNVATNDRHSAYTPYTYNTSDFDSPQHFQEKLLNPLTNKRILENPVMVFIDINAATPIADVLGMLDAAQKLSETITSKEHYHLRIVFLLGPMAYWNWISRPDLTKAREGLLTFIRLSLWTKDAIQVLLSQLKLNDSTEDIASARDITGGWYFSLDILVSLSMENLQLKEMRQLSSRITPLKNLSPKDANRMIKFCALSEHPDALALMIGIQSTFHTSPFDLDDLQLLAEEIGMENIDPLFIRRLMQWLLDLCLIKMTQTTPGQSLKYGLSKTMNHILDVHQSNG